MPKALLTTICLSAALLLSTPAWAQGGQPQVSVVTLQVVQNPDGSQSVITPKGDLAPLPGSGVYGNTAQIYMGAKGGFWYTDRNGQSVDLDAAVRQLQARRAGAQQAVQVPQYAPQPYYQAPPQQAPQQQAPAQPTEITNNYNSSGGSGSGAMGAVGTAAAAGLGAMAGAAMSNSYYNAPYGTPMYYGANGQAYGYHNGEQFEDLNQNQKMALYNQNQIKQQNQQQAIQQTQTNQQNRQGSMSENQTNRQAAYGGQQENYQKQQQWYQEQQKQNPQRFQQSENNPFVAQGGGARGGASNFAQERGAGGDRASSMSGAGARAGGGLRGEGGGGLSGLRGEGGGFRGAGGGRAAAGGFRGGGGGGRRR
ncbi:hypothetical protein KA344_04645 [bacterium]|jgi:hypothetical protein|nr:hypothetical protein [bacterium]